MKHTLLLVDDEIEFAEAFSERLELRGFRVELAHDGTSALEKAKRKEYDLILLDLRLPDIDGTEVLARVREFFPKLPVIIITGHGSEADKERCMGLGADAFLHKPVDLKRLMVLMMESI